MLGAILSMFLRGYLIEIDPKRGVLFHFLGTFLLGAYVTLTITVINGI